MLFSSHVMSHNDVTMYPGLTEGGEDQPGADPGGV